MVGGNTNFPTDRFRVTAIYVLYYNLLYVLYSTYLAYYIPTIHIVPVYSQSTPSIAMPLLYISDTHLPQGICRLRSYLMSRVDLQFAVLVLCLARPPYGDGTYPGTLGLAAVARGPPTRIQCVYSQCSCVFVATR